MKLNILKKTVFLKSKALSFTLIFLSFSAFYGQKESDNWYFGFNAGIHFNGDGSVDALTNGQLNTFEGCASVSNEQGKLLFYTDGETVYNQQHNIMENGENLYGLESSTQSAIIIPLPQNPNIYYIITAAPSFDFTRSGLFYSVVDISMNAGNGAVTLKNIRLLDDCSEKIAVVVKNCTNNSIWLVALGLGPNGLRPFNTYYSFEINSSGIVLPAIESLVNDFTDNRGYLKFSLDGRKLVNADMTSGLYLYDFNVETGVVTNSEEITINANEDIYAYGVEFSPNGNLLYVHASNDLQELTGHTASLYQYNLQAADISASQMVLDQSRSLYRGALQLGPNGKIYRSLSETFFIGTPFLGVINNPNELGAAANYEHNAVSLNGKLAAQGLPPLMASLYAEVELFSEAISLDQNELELCVGEELTLQASYFPGAAYQWEKDNMVVPNESNYILTVPTVDTSDGGVYRVTVFRPGAEACPLTTEGTVVLHELPVIMPHVLTACDNTGEEIADGFGVFNLEEIITDPNLDYTFYETIADLNADQVIQNPLQYTNTIALDQFVYFKVTNVNGCENIGEVQLQVREAPNVVLEPNYPLCTDNPNLVIQVAAEYDTYAWIKLENGSEIEVSNSAEVQIVAVGSYILLVGNTYEHNGTSITCEQSVPFTVVPSNSATIEDIIINDNAEINSLELLVSGDGDYEYSINETDYQDSNYFSNVGSGPQTVFIRDKNGCGIVMQDIELDPEITIEDFPKFFSPNGDGANDFWQYIPSASGDVNILSIEIYNRQGQFLKQLSPLSKGWDGTLNGRRLPETDYWFRAFSMNSEIIQGHFSLIR